MSRNAGAGLSAALISALLASTSALAQDSTRLDEISVAGGGGSPSAAADTNEGGNIMVPEGADEGDVSPGQPKSLTVPSLRQAAKQLQRIPGGVALVPDTAYKNRPTDTIKDILDFVPGVIVQPRWGLDARISIRGSGLSRAYGNRGINLYMDGIPINTSDGLLDLFEVDPTAYRYVEVFKGANALRFGSNALGGAINLVSPTGRDAWAFDGRVDVGSFGFVKSQVSTGKASGPADYFVTLSGSRSDGYRQHSEIDNIRGSANIGYQFSPDAETRFYLNANTSNGQIPGEVTKQTALRNPRAANPFWVLLDQQRNVDSIRLANKTTMRFEDTSVDFGAFTVQRHVDHPIFQYLDYTAEDFGGFVRATDDRLIGDYCNRLVAGVTFNTGSLDYRQYVNLGNAVKGPLTFSTIDSTDNLVAYLENSFFVLPNVAVVAGGLFQHTVRQRRDRFLSDGNQSGRRTYDLFSPKVGLVWDIAPAWQVYSNVSASAEVPTFDANSFQSPESSFIAAQQAVTYEVGTRGARPDFTWDVSLYRSDLKNELQCLTTSIFSPCTLINADRTVHQGVEAGFGLALLKSVVQAEDRVWFNTAYTYNDFFFVRDALYGNNRLPGVPEHYLRAEVLYKHPNGFYAGPNVEWSPKSYFADNANTLKVDPYALLNFRIGYDTGRDWSCYFEARNLTNKRYISTVAIAGVATTASEIFNGGVGRAFYGGLRYRW